MNPFFEEILVLIFVIIALPAMLYALERLSHKRMFSRLIIIGIYAIVFYIYIANVEKLQRGIEDNYSPYVPKFVIRLFTREGQ